MKNLFPIVLFFSVISHAVTAQLSFTRTNTIKVTDQTQLTNPWAGGLNYPMFFEIDLNGDNIMDIVAYEPNDIPGNDRIIPFINNGTPNQVDYHFAPQYTPLFPNVKGFMISYDYNKDGKMDVFSLSDATNAGIMVYRNDYTAGTGLKFTMVKDPILARYTITSSNIFASSVSVPALSDVDNDGDLDIISWPVFPNGTLEYHKGIAADSGWSNDSLRFKTVLSKTNQTLCWGGFMLEVGTSNNKVASFGNTCGQAPRYADLGWDAGTARADDTESFILVYDNDGDGDKDALIGGRGDSNGLFVLNGGTATRDSMVSQIQFFPDYNVPINLSDFPYFFFIDVDNDGAKDLVVTPHGVSNYRGILYYKNTNTTAAPVFALQSKTLLQQEMIETGTAAVPRLFDYDGDGIKDLVIGNESYRDSTGNDHKGLALYKNVGTLTSPEYQLITRDYAGIDALVGINGPLSPTFGDLDIDGDIDMIVGYSEGSLLYFENTAGPGNPANFTAPGGTYQSIDVGQASSPQLYDLNHDGMLDLIIGNHAGLIRYYENTGTPYAPVFSLANDTLGGIVLKYPGFPTGYATPFVYNDNGTDKLVVGTEAGKIYVYDGINGNIHGQYHLADSLVKGQEGQRLVPFVGDLNNDGLPDMLVGHYYGGLSLYMNSDTTVNVNVVHPLKPASTFDASPNPASDEVTLSFHRLHSPASVEMLNSIGEVVYRSIVNQPEMIIPLGGFSGGIYLLRFVSDDNRQTKKIVIRRR